MEAEHVELGYSDKSSDKQINSRIMWAVGSKINPGEWEPRKKTY